MGRIAGAGRKASGSASGPGADHQQASLLQFGFKKSTNNRSPLKENRPREGGTEASETAIKAKGAPDMATGEKESTGASTPSSTKKRAATSTPATGARSAKVAKGPAQKEQAPTPSARNTPRRVSKLPAKAALEAKLLEAAEAARVKREAKRKKDKESKDKKRLAEKAKKAAEAEKVKKEKAAERERQKAEREKLKAAQKEKERAEREAKKKAEAAERERKKAEALEAARYPIEDLQLQKEELKKGKPLKEIVLPDFTGKDEGAELGRLLYVSDVTQRFSKELGIKPVSLNVLQDALEGKEVVSAGSTVFGGPKAKPGFDIIARLYEGLLATNLEDEVNSGVGGRTERRWVALLGPGTWPEVLRRYVLTLHKFAEEEEDVVQHVGVAAAEAAAMLGRVLPEELSPSQHLLLLEALCNEALATAEFRDCLALRLEEADGVLKQLRAQRQEDRSKIREVEAELKEERRQRKLKEQAEAAPQEQAKGGAAEDDAAPAPPRDPLEEEEPSWELPPELQEFTGASDDRKGLLEWRQRATAERQRLEKEKLRWHAERRRLLKEREKAARAEHESRRAKERELERLQDELADKEEAYEQKLDKYIIRQVPLGLDRYYRRYWWGLGGVRGVVYVEAEDGCWARLSTMDELGGLVQSLDDRGIREAELLDNIDKQHGIIAKAMRRIALEAEKIKKAEEREVLRERVLPKRGAAKKASLAEQTEDPNAASVEEEALWAAIDKADEIAAMAQEEGCPPLAAGGYRKVREELQVLRNAGLRDQPGEELLEQLQELLAQLEMRLFVLSGQPEVDPEEEEEDEEEEEEETPDRGNRRRSQRMSRIMSTASVASDTGGGGSAVKASAIDLEVHEYIHQTGDEDDEVDRNNRERWRRGAKKTWMYRSIKERRSWRAALDASTCMPSLAYSAATLANLGADMVAEL